MCSLLSQVTPSPHPPLGPKTRQSSGITHGLVLQGICMAEISISQGLEPPGISLTWCVGTVWCSMGGQWAEKPVPTTDEKQSLI